MVIEQIYTKCLSQGSYYIQSGNEVAIIDPLREINPYIQKAEKANARIRFIFETHFHADFVSGHLTLAKKTGAKIIFGPNANTKFDALIAKDGQEFKIGEITIKALHTPGHTMESTTYLLIDSSKKDIAIFSGDTLFIGDVGRPDLAQKANNTSQEDLAGILYDSLREKIMPLNDDVLVYPGHGAGSACGKNLSDETVSTIGEQKKTNYALRSAMTKDEFIKEVTNGLNPPPNYFPLNVKMNKEGYDDIDKIILSGTTPLAPNLFENIVKKKNALILDVRHQDNFAEEHIPNSIFIGIDGSFAPWVGTIVEDVTKPILLVTPDDRVEETVTRLARVGFDNSLGYLKGGIKNWKMQGKLTTSVNQIDSVAFKKLIQNENLKVFDLRKSGEYSSGYIPNAQNIPLDFLNKKISNFRLNDTFYTHCAGGYRSMIAASILKSKGIHNFTDIKGGFNALRKTGLEI
tara:strand:- start:25307 stop:26689 length:1383 start_codon:yes stop_codon:yes gene_type:complete